MDKLSELPPKNDNVKSDEESEIMNKFFPNSQMAAPPGPSNGGLGQGSPQPLTTGSLTSKINWKLIGLSAALFVALANPWIDKLFCNIPYCGNNTMSLLGFKVILFITLMVAISVFC